MHNTYVEPTKQYADHVINISNVSKEGVLEEVEEILRGYLE
jgi:uridine kinase